MTEGRHTISIRQETDATGKVRLFRVDDSWPKVLWVAHEVAARWAAGESEGAAFDEDNPRILYFRLENAWADYRWVEDKGPNAVYVLQWEGSPQ